MSRTKRIYNKIQIFRNWITDVIQYDPKQKYRQLCRSNCKGCKPLKWKEIQRFKHYRNEYFIEQIQEVIF